METSIIIGSSFLFGLFVVVGWIVHKFRKFDREEAENDALREANKKYQKDQMEFKRMDIDLYDGLRDDQKWLRKKMQVNNKH
ncbi:MAG: hypothetical protein COV43_04385 [Deltaproteobacteria bacterium CG11_big_fil_rev_8_21_14_0_20_42_23]|nr:MAG: hypothetical protein COV43_04385 [Deltaproteobacteria bacterium CG11_big_fil_rev_8_21_14_0_20_42_23]PJC65012.1 MAG: hypothetical protein CO021_00775 [Deltaproteobacteria bacterium CG_4_9_14_0_2_um_filter_42_21]